jgi:cellulose synthase/poly-beta-1,6-N-acetylglucosamine synthase-like glycosyltransferase
VAYAWDGRPRADRAERSGRAPLPPPSTIERSGRPFSRPASSQRVVSSFPELDCLRQRLDARTLLDAERRAGALGVGADEVLVCAGVITAEHYARELALWLNLGFDSLRNIPREWYPFNETRLIESLASGVLPLRARDREVFVVAPSGLRARQAVAYFHGRPDRSANVWITSPDCLQQFVIRHAAATLASRAADALRMQQPRLSAAPRRSWRSFAATMGGALATAAAIFTAGSAMVAPLQVAMTGLFLGWGCLRVLALCKWQPHAKAERAAVGSLPVYTVLVALYREAAALPGLVQSLCALDYPPEKLDIKLVLEEDDAETIGAARSSNLPSQFEIVLAPRDGPRTKPKALNAALAYARGELTAVYDAEDRPEPDQLRRACAAFDAGDAHLVCVQASLTIDNTTDSWLTRLFTAEYAGLFDVLLPALSTMRLPLPLGGSSNHFRTGILRQAGAWDSYNVTEDADLGIRLARMGYRSETIASTTYEEAPAQSWPWLKQRTRWFKGWIQTWCVHMRQPWRFWRQVGAAGFFAFQFMLFGTVLAALLYPVGLVFLVSWIATGAMSPVTEMIGWLHFSALMSGYVISAALGLIGLRRRGLLFTAWVLLLMPVHWLLLSAAAWRALVQFCFNRYSWEKTEHGRARTSRWRMRREQAKRQVKVRGVASPHITDTV